MKRLFAMIAAVLIGTAGVQTASAAPKQVSPPAHAQSIAATDLLHKANGRYSYGGGHGSHFGSFRGFAHRGFGFGFNRGFRNRGFHRGFRGRGFHRNRGFRGNRGFRRGGFRGRGFRRGRSQR